MFKAGSVMILVKFVEFDDKNHVYMIAIYESFAL